MTSKKSATKSEAARSEIRVTVADQNREISVETATDRDTILAAVTKSLSTSEPLVLVDTRGRQYVIPATKISSVEIGDISERRVGFAGL
jgi:hypothetical protein